MHAARIAFLLLSAAGGVASAVAGQEARILAGRVSDAATGQAVAGVMVSPPGVERDAVATDGAGRFRLHLPAASDSVRVSALGYVTATVPVPSNGPLDVRLAPAPLALDPVAVSAERSFATASSRSVRELDLELRPRHSSQALLELAPGLVIAQHAGGGKAEQIFLRGFDADHGTDVAVSVDGTPVNMVSHAHGQGYADLHFVIPGVVERVEVRKGPFDVRDGDFATAGAVELVTRDRIDGPSVAARVGSFGTGHVAALAPLGGGGDDSGGYLAGSVDRTDGPFESPQDFSRLNAFGKWTGPVGGGTTVALTASTFAARWRASGQVPARAVRSGRIGRFGAIDDTEGGATERHDLALELRSPGGKGEGGWRVRAHATRYRFRLFSNFTYFLTDPENGDGIEQVDDRWLAGARASYERPGGLPGLPGRTSLGAGLRTDRADVVLRGQRERMPLDERVDAGLTQDHLFAWVEQQIEPAHRLRLRLGVRTDLFRFDVRDRGHVGGREDEGRSGTARHGIVSPRASAALDLARGAGLFASAGTGFHSNDARDVVVASPGDEVVPRARGAELGIRWTGGVGTVAAAVWGLDLASELVYVGDEGVTEPKGRTRRTGVDLEGRLRLASWLWADADVNLARARFRDEPPGVDRIPLAPRITSAGGLTVRDAGALEAGLRYRFVGPRPASEDGSVTAPGAVVWNLFGRWRRGPASLSLAVRNLFDVDWNEAQFATTSRLRGEDAGVTELHYTPGAPRSMELGVAYRW